MKFRIAREALLKPLQLVAGVVERRKTFPILANILVKVKNNVLTLTATDLEVELIAKLQAFDVSEDIIITIPGKKLFEICRSLADDAEIEFIFDDGRVVLRSGNSRFTLSTLSADDFPSVADEVGQVEFAVKQCDLQQLIAHTHFSMAQQDVRYFLNGMLFEIKKELLFVVATDGHRMAMSSINIPSLHPEQVQNYIVPRKGILELFRLLENSEELVNVVLSPNHIKVITPTVTFISKMIDGKFPDYRTALPLHGEKIVVTECHALKQILTRASILSNEKYRGVSVQLRTGKLNVQANNPEQEEAEDLLDIDYDGGDLDIGFNVTYLIDVLNNINGDKVKLIFKDSSSSLIMEEINDTGNSFYVIMPMKL